MFYTQVSQYTFNELVKVLIFCKRSVPQDLTGFSEVF